MDPKEEMMNPEPEPEAEAEPGQEPAPQQEPNPETEPDPKNEPAPESVPESESEPEAPANEAAAPTAPGGQAAGAHDQAWNDNLVGVLSSLPQMEAAEFLSQMSAANLRLLRGTSTRLRAFVDGCLSLLLNDPADPSLPRLVRRDSGRPAKYYFNMGKEPDIPGLLKDFRQYQLNTDFNAQASATMDTHLRTDFQAGMRVLRLYYRADPTTGYLVQGNAVAMAYIRSLIANSRLLDAQGNPPLVPDAQVAQEFIMPVPGTPQRWFWQP